MSLETRGNRMVYYCAKRIGDRVAKAYVSSGPVALAIADCEANERLEQKTKRNAEHAYDRELDSAEADLDAVDHVIAKELARAGLHRPKRNRWRKRRQ